MRKGSICLLLGIIIFCIFNACKKIDHQPTLVDVSEVKMAVQKWHNEFSKTASEREVKLADDIIGHLDYTYIDKVILNNDRLYIIGILDNKNTARKRTTLGIKVSNNIFSLEGVFQITGKARVVDFYQQRNLMIKDSLIVLNLKRYPLYGWTKRIDGAIAKLEGRSLPKGTAPTKDNFSNTQLKKGMDYIVDPEQEPCVDHFVIYYDGYGQIIDIVQLASTGNCDGNDGSQGGGTNSEPPDGCASAQAAAATSFANNTPQFATAKNNIVNAANDGKEHSIRFGKDANGNVILSNMSTGDATSATNSAVSNAFADIHNHPQDLPFSAGDVYNLMRLYQGNNNYATRYVVLPNGSEYALVITNATAVSNFLNSYPSMREPGYPPNFPDALLDTYVDIQQTQKFTVGEQVSHEMAMAYILDNFNAGVALLKKDANGNFKKLSTTASTNNGNTTYSQQNCN